VAAALLSAYLLDHRANVASIAASGAALYNAGQPGLAYPYLTRAVRRTSLQAKPCLDLGDLAVWTIDDGVFQHFYHFDDPRTLVRLAFLSYVEALDRQPGSSKAWAGLADLFKKERILRIKTGTIDLDALEAVRAAGLEEEDKLVIEAYRRAIRFEPNNYFYQAYLGDYYDERGLRKEALASYGKAIEIMPDLSWHYYIPEKDVPADLYQAARQALENATVSNPLYPRHLVWLNLALLAERNGDFDSAVGYYRKAISAAPDPSAYLQMLGARLFEMKRYDDAESTLKEALALDTLQPRTKGTIYATLGRCAMIRNDNRAAVEYLKQARWLNPSGTYINIELAQAYEALGMLDRAEAEYEAAIRIDPDRAGAYTALIDMYRRTHQINRAISLARKLIEMYPDSEIFKEQLRSLNRELGRPEAG
jgi:tetratricopeptide (TPR) repeat protein